LQYCSSKEQLKKLEKILIKKFNSCDPRIGYNRSGNGHQPNLRNKMKGTKIIKVMSAKEAWSLADKLAEKLGNIQAVADHIGAAASTIYKWGQETERVPDLRITMELRELAIKEGIIKA
jgi:hypothetical protein